MLAVSRTHHLPPHRLAALVRRETDSRFRHEGPPGDPSLAQALLAHLAGLALGATLILGTTIGTALGLSLVLP